MNTIYSRVKTRRENGTYNVLLKRAEEKRRIGNLVVDITSDDGNDVQKEDDRNVSPISMDTSLSTSKESVSADSASQSQKQSSSSSSSSKGAPRLCSRQKSVARLNSKRTKLDYDGRFKAGFKDATNLVAANRGIKGTEPVQSILCTRLNLDYALVSPKRLRRSRKSEKGTWTSG